MTDSSPELLDPALTAVLDYPLYFRDDGGPFCRKPGCRHPDCEGAWGDGTLASHRRMTVREFLADVQKHAEYAADQEGSRP